MLNWDRLEKLDKLFVVWAFLFQIVLIVHFALRKPFFESYGKSWSFWLGGFLFVVFAAFGYRVDYAARIPFRNPLRLKILIPYIFSI